MTVIAVMLALVGSSPVSANVTATTGQLIKISPPSDVLQSGLCSPDKVFTFDEQQGVTLGADVRVDYKTPGSYTAYAGNPIPYVPSGTVVDSHFLDSNLGSCAGTANREGTWTFSQDILGVIVARPRLVNSDYLGSPTTVYPGSVPSREFDFGSGTSADFVQIIDARTIYVKLQTPYSSADQMRVLTKHNAPPVPNAGGPYVGAEGSPVALSGTAPDPDSDAVAKSWSFTWPLSPGTSCTTTGTTTLTPTITCNDDALVTATLSASDGYHPAVTSVANVTIENRNPTITSVTVPTTPVALGSSVNLSSVFADAGSHDTHTASIAWGDTTMSAGTVNESGHSVTASHIYATPGVYSLTLTVNDDDGGTVSVGTTDVTVVGPPTASAGGPYNVDEGTSIGLFGSASGSLPLTKSWLFTPGPSDLGTTCLDSGSTTLTPTVLCNDDVVVGATLTVSDGVNPPVVSSSSIAVTNVAPVLGSLAATAGPIIVGQPVTVGGSFTDVGVNDTHSSTADWGDLTTSVGAVSESGGSGSVSATHSYSIPGMYTVAVDVNDGDGGVATRTITIHVNTPPTANAGGPYVGPEGSTLSLAATAGDDDSDALTKSWSFAQVADAGTTCTPTGPATLTPTITCDDNAIVLATLSVSDGVNPPVVSVATVTFGNVAPAVGALTATPSIQGVGASVSASASFTDVGTHDTHTAMIDWGDGSSAASMTESAGAGSATGSHLYADVGIYAVSMTVTDDNGGATTVSTSVVVYDPTGPFVTANGNFNSPSGAYTPDNPTDPNVIGTAHIDFLAKYQHGDTVPTGHGAFRFNAAGLTLDSTGYFWLIVTPAGDETFFRGTGNVNGVSGYEFLVSGIDGSPDLVRIKVWQTSTGMVVYDSQPGAADDADPVLPLTGSLNIH